MSNVVVRSLVVALIVCVASVVGFGVGRFSAPAPRFEVQPVAEGEDELDAAWQTFVQAQNDTLALFKGSHFYEEGQTEAEAYRGVLYALVGSIVSNGLTGTEDPRFVPAADWSTKSGLDNPDNNYSAARIRDNAEYRVTGTRGTTKNLFMQLLYGQPGVGDGGTSTNISMLGDTDMVFADDGSFEVIVSRRDPGDGANWLRIDNGAETLLVRQTFSDWQHEQAGQLYIEQIDRVGAAYPLLTKKLMAERLRAAAVSLYDRNATWLKYSDMAWTTMPRNGIASARASRGGLVGQYSAFGTWELRDDQAIIITTHPTSASYQGVELGNLWFVSLDYESRTSSLTADQADLSSDGLYHFVVSARDPGVHNWLNTEEHERGLIMMRWQGLDAAIPDALQPTARLVDFDRLNEELPAEVLRVSDVERREQISARRRAALRRAAE